MLHGKFLHFAHILHADRLSTGEVDSGGQTDVGDLRRANFIHQLFKLLEVNIALEGMDVLGVMGLVNNDIDKLTAIGLLVVARGGEVHIPRHIVAGPNHYARQNVFGTAPLMGGHDILKAIDFLYGAL